jgi:hypothetical protein
MTMTVDSGLQRLLIVYMVQGQEGREVERQRGTTDTNRKVLLSKVNIYGQVILTGKTNKQI